ncbi:Pol protein [Phytophthora palmivora]|uniref:Pol protein n=1 Tax=Phytophthora palmivora TaxID=4796 RepID=A0A2P4YFH3_9STRA|nr:Pol protein [Phytophthora palmivora]
MPQRISNSQRRSNAWSQLVRPLHSFVQTYFGDIFLAIFGTVMEVHLNHLLRVFEVTTAHKLYANIEKTTFAAVEIKVLSCFVSRVGVRADSGKVKAIADWPTPRPQKDSDWVWEQQHQDTFDIINASIQHEPVLALADENYTPMMRFLFEVKDAKTQLRRCELADGLPHCRVAPGDPPRVVVPNDEDLKYDILLKANDARMSGHLGQNETYQAVSQTFWCPHMYKWVAHYVKTCETCQRMKLSDHASLPLQGLPVPAKCWKSMSLDFAFDLPVDGKGNTSILVFICRFSKMAHLVSVRDKVIRTRAVQLLLDSVFRYHGLLKTIVSDRDPRFPLYSGRVLYTAISVTLTKSTANHPQTNDQTERDNRVFENTLRSICAEAPRSWSDQLPMDEFALNNTIHSSTGFTPFH